MALDLQRVQKLNQHALYVYADEEVITSDVKGISFLLEAAEKKDTRFNNAQVYDIIVGKAASMLFIDLNVSYVYGKVMSKAADDILTKYSIPHNYGELVDHIINRQKDGPCPMEKTVENISDISRAKIALRETLNRLMKE